MRVQIPTINFGQYINNIASAYSFKKYIAELSASKKRVFEEYHKNLTEKFPIIPDKSEDYVVEHVMTLLKKAGWNPRDRRSTFIPGTDLRPDIWLDDRIAFVEALRIRNSGTGSEWTEHCKRCVAYARHAGAQLAICTDGRRWFFVSTVDGEPKTAFIDLKRYDPDSDEAKILSLMTWSDGPLFKEAERVKLKKSTEIGKGLFKKHILKCGSQLDDNYREYFGLISACAYAHYNSSKAFDTSAILEATYALVREHNEVAINVLKNFFVTLSKSELPGLSNISTRVAKIIGKNEKLDLLILKSTLVDNSDRPISWETFDSDDLSEVYEEILKPRRKRNGIYATPRDLCYEVVKHQFTKSFESGLPKTLALVDPCCGSGSFLDQSIKAVGKELLPAEQKRKNLVVKELHFLGQDLEEMAAALTLVNVYVACIRHLWHLESIDIQISVSCGDTTDRRSPIYKKVSQIKPKYTIVFGNPPYIRSRSAQFGGVTREGNFLYQVTEQVMSLCNPGELAFVLPAHVKGGEASEEFDEVPGKYDLKLTELWHLPEMTLFRNCAEKRHVVVFWKKDTRANARVYVLTPPKDAHKIGVQKSIQQSKNSKVLQFATSETKLSAIPMYSNLHIPKELKQTLERVDRLSLLKDKKIVTIVQGIQEAHPYVPASHDSKGELTRYGKIIEMDGLEVGEPLFVIPRKTIRELTRSPKKPLTAEERKHLRLHAKSSPNELRLSYPKSSDKVLFCNQEVGNLSEEQFMDQFPHYYSWLRKFHGLLMLDIDRKSKQLKWWELQRSRDPRPNATTRPGVDFNDDKILVNQFLNGELWAWFDENKHVAAGSNFNLIAKFPGSNNKDLRKNWHRLMALWLNSYVIRQVWLKLLGNCKVRGADGEVQIKKHLLKLPVPKELALTSQNKKIEGLIKQLSAIASTSSDKITISKLKTVDILCWKLLEEVTGSKLGKPMTRADGDVEFKAAA